MQSHSHNFICKPSCHLIFSNSLKLAETFHCLSRVFAAGGCLFSTLGCAEWRALCFTFVSDKRGRWQLYRDQVSSPALVFMCVGMDAKENTAELHCGSSCRTCSRPGWVNQEQRLLRPASSEICAWIQSNWLPRKYHLNLPHTPCGKCVSLPGEICQRELGCPLPDGGRNGTGVVSLGGIADVSSVSAVGGLVCETELHLSVLGNSVQNSPELPGWDRRERGRERAPRRFPSPWYLTFGTLGLKDMKAWKLQKF